MLPAVQSENEPGTTRDETSVTAESNRRKRRHRQDTGKQRSLEPWISSFLESQQKEDPDVCQVQAWLQVSTTPVWDDL